MYVLAVAIRWSAMARSIPLVPPITCLISIIFECFQYIFEVFPRVRACQRCSLAILFYRFRTFSMGDRSSPLPYKSRTSNYTLSLLSGVDQRHLMSATSIELFPRHITRIRFVYSGTTDTPGPIRRNGFDSTKLPDFVYCDRLLRSCLFFPRNMLSWFLGLFLYFGIRTAFSHAYF